MAVKLDVRRLTVELPTSGGWIRPVDEVSFALGEGETLGVVGESGSGKTMLALALMGLQPEAARRSGEVWLHRGAQPALDLISLDDAEMRSLRGREIAMVFQEPMSALNPVLRVGAQVEEAIRIHEPRLRRSEVRRKALESLHRAAISEPARRARDYPHQLSGGLRQRALIAMALAASPSILIADEPTTALDVTLQRQILDLLEALGRELRLSLILITHDLGVVQQAADRIVVMYAGRVVEQGATDEVLGYPRHPYTKGLLRAQPRLRRGALEPIPGAVPALEALPPGCAFAPRCSYHVRECDERVPDLIEAGGRPETHRARCILVR